MEAPVVAEQHGDVGALEVRGDDVGTAITIHVGCAQALVRMAAYGVLRARRGEAALAVSEYDCDFVLGPALDGYVDVAVAVQVGVCAWHAVININASANPSRRDMRDRVKVTANKQRATADPSLRSPLGSTFCPGTQDLP